MSRMNVGGRWCAWCIALIWLAGCGSSGNLSVYPVKGKITFEGQPMKGGGAITFVPTGGQAGAQGGGEIKEDGTYELTTYEPGDGSIVGDFRVVITQVTVKEPTPAPDGSAPTPADGPNVAPADQIPQIYGDYTNSPLTAKVEAKPNEAMNFDLKRQ
jgi:hypothetical protein